jgi:hypothetical protein
MGINPGPMTVAQYELRSIAAWENAWAEYEGEGRDVAAMGYYPIRAYFVDDALVVAITDEFRHNFITCYHEHFDNGHLASCGNVGDLRLDYLEYLDFQEQGGMIRNLTRIRGV